MILKPAHLKRTAEIAAVLTRHGLADLVVRSGIGALVGVPPVAPHEETKRTRQGARLRSALEELGPTFVKMGQFLSTRPDLLPAEYIQELSRLQDDSVKVPFERIRAIVEEDLGLKLSEAFAAFDEEPRAAASLAQVHNAVLHTGECVVVKVQRPEVHERVNRDLDLLTDLAAWMAEHTDAGKVYDLPGVVRELRITLTDEMNYRIEAGNLRTFERNLREFQHIRIPRVFDELSSRRVLTMERLDGVKVTEYPVIGREKLCHHLAREFIEAYLKQIAIDGAVHSDPHAGNVLVAEENHLVLMDFGMVVHIDEKMRSNFVRLLISYAEGDAFHATETLLDISTVSEDSDVAGFRSAVSHSVARDQHLPPEESMGGLVLLQMTQMAFRFRIQVPSTATMLAKTLLSMSHIAQHLSPTLNLGAVIRDYLSNALVQQYVQNATPGRSFRAWGEWEQMVTYTPMRINRILDLVADNQLQVRVVTRETEELIEGLQKIANRIAFGIIDGAIIVGSALMMQYHVGPHLWGFPMLATIGFLAATIMGFWLLVSIFIHDRRKPRP